MDRPQSDRFPSVLGNEAIGQRSEPPSPLKVRQLSVVFSHLFLQTPASSYSPPEAVRYGDDGQWDPHDIIDVAVAEHANPRFRL